MQKDVTMAVLGNIGPRSWLYRLRANILRYGPTQVRLVSRFFERWVTSPKLVNVGNLRLPPVNFER